MKLNFETLKILLIEWYYKLSLLALNFMKKSIFFVANCGCFEVIKKHINFQ